MERDNCFKNCLLRGNKIYKTELFEHHFNNEGTKEARYSEA